MPQACRDCRFWVSDAPWNQQQILQLKKLLTGSTAPTQWVQDRLEYYQARGDGRCHYNPPVAVYPPSSTADVLAVFPLLPGNSWCRHWAARDE